MTRWSLSNYFTKTSFNEFLTLGHDFHKACEEAFETECALDIRFLSRPKSYTTFLLDDDAMQSIEDENRHAETAKATSLDELTKTQWDEARYAEITVRPVNKEDAPNYAFGNAEFKGNMPRTATFYMQGGEKTNYAAHTMSLKHKYKVLGDGFDSNGSMNANAFLSAASSLGMPARHIAQILSSGRNKFDL